MTSKKSVLSNRQIAKITKAKKKGTGCSLKLSKTQIKKGGFFPLLFPALAALGALAGGAGGIAKAVGDAKAKARDLAEAKRHNAIMEGRGLKKKKRGKGVYVAPRGSYAKQASR